MSKTRNGQLKPLEERMNPNKLAKRAAKIEARRTVAQALAVDAFNTRGMLLLFANMNILQRLLWVVFGKLPSPKRIQAPKNLTVRTVPQGE